MVVGRNIKRLRQKKGWSQYKLAEVSGVSQPMISQIETGDSDGTPATWRKIATALGVTISDPWKDDE